MSEINKWRYGFFLGCVAPNRYPMIESSIRAVFDHLGAEIWNWKEHRVAPLQGFFERFIFQPG